MPLRRNPPASTKRIAATEEFRSLHESVEPAWTNVSPLAACEIAFLDDDLADGTGFQPRTPRIRITDGAIV